MVHTESLHRPSTFHYPQLGISCRQSPLQKVALSHELNLRAAFSQAHTLRCHIFSYICTLGLSYSVSISFRRLLEHSEAIRELQARRSAIALKLDDLVNSAAQYEVVRPCEYSQTPPSPSLAVKNTESEEQRPSGLALLQDLRTATVSVHQTSITAHHVSQLVEEKTTSLRRMLYLRRVYTIAAVLQLQQVYQIRPPRFNNSSESGRQKGVSEFWTIDSLPLSHRDYVSPSPVTSDAALGTIAQCVDVLAQYLNVLRLLFILSTLTLTLRLTFSIRSNLAAHFPL